MDIVCDVDGILANLMPEWLARYNAEYHDSLAEAQITSWDVTRFVKPECGARIYQYLTDPTLYDNIIPEPGAQAGIFRLRELGHSVVFGSHCAYGMVDAKARWLERYGFVRPNTHTFLPAEFIPIQDKTRLAGDVLIDDGPHNISAWASARRRAIYLETMQNSRVAIDMPSMFFGWVSRAHSWPEIVHFVETL